MARRAKSSREYWLDREAEQRKKDIVDRMAYNREIRRIYQATLDDVQKQIDAFYGKYAKKEGITLAEAKRRVSQLDIEAYERKAKRYVKERDFSKQANEEMRLYNLTMKVNRFEMLKSDIGLELAKGFDDLDKTFDEKLHRHARNEFERLAGILGDSVRNNPELAHAIVNASFHNATFSERIWAHQDALKAALDVQIQRGLIQGKSSIALARDIRKQFETSRSDAERLMITEMRRVRTDVARISYEQNGNTHYQFLALGARPCSQCLDMDGQVFPVKDMMPGTNSPPMHPRCECTTAPYWDEAKFQEWLDSGAAADGVPWADFAEEQNPVTNGVDSGILNSSGLEPIPITNKAIDSVPLIRPTGWSEEQAERLQEAHKELLTEAAKHPTGTEVGAVYNTKLKNLDSVVGGVGTVSIPQFSEEHIVLHNHPDGELFSEGDIEPFLMRAELQAVTAVGNDGSLYYIGKTESYDGFQFGERYLKVLEELKKHKETEDSDGYIKEMRKFLMEAGEIGVEFIERKAQRTEKVS